MPLNFGDDIGVEECTEGKLEAGGKKRRLEEASEGRKEKKEIQNIESRTRRQWMQAAMDPARAKKKRVRIEKERRELRRRRGRRRTVQASRKRG